jgi:hypothetical protein
VVAKSSSAINSAAWNEQNCIIVKVEAIAFLIFLIQNSQLLVLALVMKCMFLLYLQKKILK